MSKNTPRQNVKQLKSFIDNNLNFGLSKKKKTKQNKYLNNRNL